MNRSTRFSLYDILNVPRAATSTEIKAAFRSLALKHHPDKHHNSAESTATFKTIHNAYTILANPATRERYDRVLGADPRDIPHRPTRPALIDSTPTATLSLLLDHLNFVMWDIEDFLQPGKRPATTARTGNWDNQLFMMLTFIDRWVLQTAGLPDYFFQARGLKPAGQIGGTTSLPYQNLHRGHQPYKDIADYFYTVRRRVDELFRKAKLIDLSSQLAGTSLTLTDCILEAHNYCVHYLGWMKRGGEEGGAVRRFRHTHPIFERTD